MSYVDIGTYAETYDYADDTLNNMAAKVRVLKVVDPHATTLHTTNGSPVGPDMRDVFWRKTINKLSPGYRQRVGMAQALLHDPDILILDEPTSGLDPNQVHGVRELITSLGQSKTILLSTHILQEVKAVCSRVLLIHDGQIVLDGDIADLEGEQHDMDLTFRQLTGAAG